MVLEDLDFLYPMRTRQQHAAKTTNVLSALDIICIILFEEYHLEILNDLKGWVERMMNDLVVEIDWHRNRVMQCKERDSIRGRQIISDYDIVHGTEAATGESSFCSTPIDDILSIVDESASTAKADVLSLRNALLHSLMS